MQVKIITAVFFVLTLLPLSSAEGISPYFPGEELVYRVTALRFLSAGTASFSVEEVRKPGEGKFYALHASATSSPPFSFFYRIRNSLESTVSAATFLPVKFEKNRREAVFRRNIKIEFDRKKNLAVPGDGSEPFSVPRGVHDYLSAFYHMRGLDYVPGESIVFSATGGRKTYDVEIEALRKETMVYRGREFDTFVVRPSAGDFETGGLVKKDSPDMLVWITADERRLPLRLELDVAFGRVIMMLINYTEGRAE